MGGHPRQSPAGQRPSLTGRGPIGGESGRRGGASGGFRRGPAGAEEEEQSVTAPLCRVSARPRCGVAGGGDGYGGGQGRGLCLRRPPCGCRVGGGRRGWGPGRGPSAGGRSRGLTLGQLSRRPGPAAAVAEGVGRWGLRVGAGRPAAGLRFPRCSGFLSEGSEPAALQFTGGVSDGN